MKIKRLIKSIPGIQLKGPKDIEIGSVTENSTLVSPGALFICKSGSHPKASQYIMEAISAGAAAIATDIYNPMLKDTTQLVHPEIEKFINLLAAEFYGFPSQELFTVGITGTNGKTTTAFLIKHLQDSLGSPCGLIGTIEYIIGNHRYKATHTTPDACTNQKLLREMRLQGCTSAVMEVSSHALDQGRVDGIDFDVAIFTNLTSEHLDYHVNMDKYAEAKRRLFANLTSPSSKGSRTKIGIVNSDSPWHAYMVDGQPHFTYGINNAADLQATHMLLYQTHTEFKLQYQGQSYPCRFPLIGKHNIYNCMAAIAVGLTNQHPMEVLVGILEKAPQVPGRLQPVPNDLGISIYVDFAHSEDALLNVLSTLQQLKSRRIITVFGCGGDRDREKRPKMAQAAESLSDFVIITSDNPRSEDPQSICAEIAAGLTSQAKFCIEIDRKKAIGRAVELSDKGDIILIAGKGHESSQIFKHQTVEFNDYKVALMSCNQESTTVESI
jgi:UDP-N-acetylmuramoyl-L-alanyl-D-glutamate--2,6-diaminopimelate ligase